MFQINDTFLGREVVSERKTFGIYPLAKGATNVAINCCWRRHRKTWLHTHHEVWVAEGSGDTFQHDLKHLHSCLLCQPQSGFLRIIEGLSQILKRTTRMADLYRIVRSGIIFLDKGFQFGTLFIKIATSPANVYG